MEMLRFVFQEGEMIEAEAGPKGWKAFTQSWQKELHLEQGCLNLKFAPWKHTHLVKGVSILLYWCFNIKTWQISQALQFLILFHQIHICDISVRVTHPSVFSCCTMLYVLNSCLWQLGFWVQVCTEKVMNKSNSHCYLRYCKHNPTTDIDTFNATALLISVWYVLIDSVSKYK